MEKCVVLAREVGVRVEQLKFNGMVRFWADIRRGARRRRVEVVAVGKSIGERLECQMGRCRIVSVQCFVQYVGNNVRRLAHFSHVH